MSEIRDINLWESGEKKMAWAKRYMPLLNSIEAEFLRDKPFKGLKISVCLHLEAKSAVLCRVVAAGGAEVRVCGSNPLSTQDDVCAALVKGGVEVFATYGCTMEEYEHYMLKALEHGPNIVIDDGADLVSLIHSKLPELVPNILGGCEETTTGIIRLQAMAREGALKFPMLTVNDAKCKHFFDNRYGTGQSVWDGINRLTNLVVAGKNVVVAGYGWCGRGIAMRSKGLGARVTHFEKMKDGALLSNGGHFDVEVDVKWLREHAVDVCDGRDGRTKGYTLKNGKTLFVLSEGRLVNLASGDGHPVEIMDMSFAIQALGARYIADNRGRLPATAIEIPDEIDYDVASRKLEACGMHIDTLSEKQKNYLESWEL